MKKLTLFVLLLLFTRGLTFYVGGNGHEKPFAFDNLFLGYEVVANGNLNQVLALAIGPRGLAGPAGVAGKSGFVGLNGFDGQDGIDGAPGPIGPGGPMGPAGSVGVAGAPGPAGANGAPGAPGATGPAGANGAPGPAGANGAPGVSGTAVAVITLAPGDSHCSAGGVKLVSSDGTASYVCSGSASVTIGGGSAELETCDDAVDLGMLSHFDTINHRFVLDGIRVMGLSSRCVGHRLDITLSTTAPDHTNIAFVCTVLTLPDPVGQDLYLARPAYNLKYGESGLVVPLVCDPTLSTMDLLILDSILGFQLT